MGTTVFINLIQKTPAYLLVGTLTLAWILTLFGVAIVYRKIGAVRDLGLHLPKIVLYGALCTLSVFAWQYVTRETGWWLFVLAGTPFEAIMGYTFTRAYTNASSTEQKFVKLLLNLLWYAPFVLTLTWVGAHIFAQSSAMVSEKVHPVVYFVLWACLLILAIWVGKMTHSYVDRSLAPMLDDWKKRYEEYLAARKIEEDETKRQDKEVAEEAEKQRQIAAKRLKALTIADLELTNLLGLTSAERSRMRNELEIFATDMDTDNPEKAAKKLIAQYKKMSRPPVSNPDTREARVVESACYSIVSGRVSQPTAEEISEVRQAITSIFQNLSREDLGLADRDLTKLLEREYFNLNSGFGKTRLRMVNSKERWLE